MSIWKRQEQVHVDESYRYHFPGPSFRSVDDFKNAEGTVLKDEPSTVIKRIRGASRGDVTFFYKLYRRSGLELFRLIGQDARARREYENLQTIQNLNVLVPAPVAYGTRTELARQTHESFLITEFVQGETFRTFLQRWDETDQIAEVVMKQLLSRLAEDYHRLHGHRFFLLTTSTRDILLSESGPRSEREPAFFDVPNSTMFKNPFLASWGQAKDLGRLLKGMKRRLDDRYLTFFLNKYLPDPLENSEYILRNRIHRALKRQADETPLTKLIHNVKKDLTAIFE